MTGQIRRVIVKEGREKGRGPLAFLLYFLFFSAQDFSGWRTAVDVAFTFDVVVEDFVLEGDFAGVLNEEIAGDPVAETDFVEFDVVGRETVG